MLVIPAVDVLGGTVVRLRQGEFGAKTVYGHDPATQVTEFGNLGAELVHVVDLDGARTGRPTPRLWDAIAATGIPFNAGGGIRTADVAAQVVATGASRVVVGTAAVWDQPRFEEIVDAVGGDQVIAAIDVRAGRARGAGWTDRGRPVAEVFDAVADTGVGTVLVTSVVADGTLAGPDLDLLTTASQHQAWKVIASGGIGSLSDLSTLADQAFWGAVVGRALYERRFTLPEAIAAARASD